MARMMLRECMLDRHNTRSLDGQTIGDRILKQGKRRLWNLRRKKPDTVVIHYISAADIDRSRPYDEDLVLKIFCDLLVSCHYMITRDGTVMRLVPEQAKAWHCGGSIMPAPDNRRKVNNFSIGIELVATKDSGFTDAQYGSLDSLCRDIEDRYGTMTYCGHEDIAGNRAVSLGLRKGPKIDPGPLFDWDRLGRPRCRDDGAEQD